jgi:hypothetical protein
MHTGEVTFWIRIRGRFLSRGASTLLAIVSYTAHIHSALRGSVRTAL